MTEHDQNSRFDLPRPHRTISGERVVARPRVEVPGPEISVGFSDEEPPTADLPKPILKLLLRATIPTEQEATPEPVATIAPTPEETAASAHPRPTLRRRRPFVTLFAGSLFVALVGVSVWRTGLALYQPAPSHPTNLSDATEEAPVSAARIENPKADVRLAAPQGTTPLRRLDTVSLLVEDGSESTAPTCDELLAGDRADRKRWPEHFRAARAALIRGDLDASQRAFCQATGASDAPAMVSLELGQLLLLRRDARAASVWLQQAASLSPESKRILELQGDAAVRVGNLDEARSAWLRAAGVSANDGPGIDRLLRRALAEADASLRARDPRRAERLLRRVLAFRPDDAPVHAKLGIALTRLGFAKSAELWFRRSAELDG
ncbi:MAG: tetratricopeptide repeat protein [Myxococcota bacterium]|nr:tetratricopeptide repeat protein [Myxococcota bacterium]